MVFGSAEGKRVLHDLIARHYVLGSTFQRRANYNGAINEGQREVVLHILRYMQMKPNDIPRRAKRMLQQFELELPSEDANAVSTN